MSDTEHEAKQILVVDDELPVRDVISRALQRDGFRVSGAPDGVEALQRLEQQRFDLIVADVWMPRMTGLELLARIKDRPGAPRAILMTGDSTPATVMAAVREQAFWYIPKPFRSEELLRLVRRALASTSTAPPIEVVSATPQWVELLVPCEHESAYRVYDFMIQMEAELPLEMREKIGYAFRELLLNAVEWGGELDPSRKVRISYLRAKRVLVYRISDPGKGFRLEDLVPGALGGLPHDFSEHTQGPVPLGGRPGGLGILMTHALVDELIYNEQRNEVVFMKYLD